jgi:tRNA threonylcarbamoyladenosine biosynthesis protein TsaE
VTAGAVQVDQVGPESAETVLALIHESFGAREVLDPPSTALFETAESVADALASDGGLVATMEGEAVGSLIFEDFGPLLGLRRVSVRPESQGLGIAGALVATAESVAWARGYSGIRLIARSELPKTVRFWTHLDYDEIGRDDNVILLGKELPIDLMADTAEEMRDIAVRLAGALEAGDLIVLSGDLGAGKTTFTQGLGAGLEVRGAVTSPTFVISRVHPPLGDRPGLVHVDAYRLGAALEIDDLDLDASMASSVTVVEWGEGKVEDLADSRLEIAITRRGGGEAAEGDGDPRHVRLTPVGARWVGSGLRSLIS